LWWWARRLVAASKEGLPSWPRRPIKALGRGRHTPREVLIPGPTDQSEVFALAPKVGSMSCGFRFFERQHGAKPVVPTSPLLRPYLLRLWWQAVGAWARVLPPLLERAQAHRARHRARLIKRHVCERRPCERRLRDTVGPAGGLQTNVLASRPRSAG